MMVLIRITNAETLEEGAQWLYKIGKYMNMEKS